MSSSLNDGILSNFVYAFILIELIESIAHYFLFILTELWPLINVKIMFLFNTLGMD